MHVNSGKNRNVRVQKMCRLKCETITSKIFLQIWKILGWGDFPFDLILFKISLTSKLLLFQVMRYCQIRASLSEMIAYFKGKVKINKLLHWALEMNMETSKECACLHLAQDFQPAVWLGSRNSSRSSGEPLGLFGQEEQCSTDRAEAGMEIVESSLLMIPSWSQNRWNCF